MNEKEIPEIRCPQCGLVIPDSSLICPNCTSSSYDTIGDMQSDSPSTFSFADVDFGPSDEELENAFTPNGMATTYPIPTIGASSVAPGAALSINEARASLTIDGVPATDNHSDGEMGAFGTPAAMGDFTETFDPETLDAAKTADSPVGVDGAPKILPIPMDASTIDGALTALAGETSAAEAAGSGAVAASTGVAMHSAPIVEAVGSAPSATLFHSTAHVAASSATSASVGAGAGAAGAATVATAATSSIPAGAAAATAGTVAASAGMSTAAKAVIGIALAGIIAGGGGYTWWDSQRVDYTASYLDAITSEPLAPPETGTGNSGEEVTLSAQNIDGYEAEATSQTITLSAGETAEATFLYRKEVSYAVRCVDQDGATLQEGGGNGLAGHKVTESAPNIDGYELASNDKLRLTLQEDEAANVMQFDYVKKVVYTVAYRTTDGTQLDSATGDGVVGALIDPPDARSFDGYYLVSSPQPITLAENAGENQLVFTYERIPEPEPIIQQPTKSKKKDTGATADF